MKQDELRLECLKLAMRRDKSIDGVISDAKQLEDFIKSPGPTDGNAAKPR